MQRTIRILIGAVVVLGVFIFLLALVTLAPVNRTPAEEQPFYARMMKRIDSVMALSLPKDTASIRVGFGKASITPPWPVSTAGYVKRRGAVFSSVRDSVYVRVMSFEKGSQRAAVISLDMLIVPPQLYRMLDEALRSDGLPAENIFFGATHTHNSIGQWDDHLVGEIYAGKYHRQLMDFMVRQIKLALSRAFADLQRADFKAASVSVREAVINRLIANGPVDSILHLLVVNRKDGSKGILTSYTAHATCLSSGDLRLSADYPGELVKKLEANGYGFAMFLAGAVGSHAPPAWPDGDEKIRRMGTLLESAVRQANEIPMHAKHLRMHRIPLLLGRQQIKISTNWRVRPWLSERLLGEANAALTVLQISDMVLIGTPCDFSGMLSSPVYAVAANNNIKVMITSFNGGYIGYVTPDAYYDLHAYETKTMNWYGPGNGKYLTDCLLRIIGTIGKQNR